MLLELNVIEGPYLQDILAQPEALRRSLVGFDDGSSVRTLAKALAAGRFHRVVLTGMGSSLHALYPLHLNLTGRGFPSLLIETSELIHYLDTILGATTLVIAVSQSGQSAEIVRLLEAANGRSPVVGVTNSPASGLALQSDACVLTRAGAESTVSCKTYVATLVALEWLGAILAERPLAETRELLLGVIPDVERYLRSWRQHVADLREVVAGIKQVVVAGRGASLATAQTGGLILKESTRIPAEGMSCAAFRHGPLEMTSSNLFVLVLAGDERAQPLNARLVQDVKNAGGKAALVGPDGALSVFTIPSLPDATRPVVEILPVQMLSLALAARSGREAGRFELASKVTSVE